MVSPHLNASTRSVALPSSDLDDGHQQETLELPSLNSLEPEPEAHSDLDVVHDSASRRILPVSMTGYRMLSSALLLGFGAWKFVAAYYESSPVLGASDLFLGAIYVVWCVHPALLLVFFVFMDAGRGQWMGYIEAERPKRWVPFFHRDLSGLVVRFFVVDGAFLAAHFSPAPS